MGFALRAARPTRAVNCEPVWKHFLNRESAGIALSSAVSCAHRLGTFVGLIPKEDKGEEVDLPPDLKDLLMSIPKSERPRIIEHMRAVGRIPKPPRCNSSKLKQQPNKGKSRYSEPYGPRVKFGNLKSPPLGEILGGGRVVSSSTDFLNASARDRRKRLRALIGLAKSSRLGLTMVNNFLLSRPIAIPRPGFTRKGDFPLRDLVAMGGLGQKTSPTGWSVLLRPLDRRELLSLLFADPVVPVTESEIRDLERSTNKGRAGAIGETLFKRGIAECDASPGDIWVK